MHKSRLGTRVIDCRGDDPDQDWWVMRAPSGHRFCVVHPQRSDFEENANRWE